MECSNHGKKINNFCHCDDGWSGISDFNPVDGIHCEINITTLRILCMTKLIMGVVVIFLMIKKLSQSLMNDKMRRTNCFHPKLRLIHCLFLSKFFMIIDAIINLSYPIHRVVGSQNYLSIYALLSIIGFSWCEHLATANYVLAMINFIHNYSTKHNILSIESKNSITLYTNNLSKFINPLAIFYCLIFAILEIIMTLKHEYATEILIIILIFLAISCITNALFRLLIINVILLQIKQTKLNFNILNNNNNKIHNISENNDKYIQIAENTTIIVSKKLQETRFSLYFMFLIAIISLLYAFIPFLRRKFVYFTFILAFLSTFIQYKIFKSISTKDKNESIIVPENPNLSLNLSNNQQNNVPLGEFIDDFDDFDNYCNENDENYDKINNNNEFKEDFSINNIENNNLNDKL